MIDRRRSIGIASKEVGLEDHVIRYWETQFPNTIKPTIGAGGRRYYYDKDIKVLLEIKKYLHEEKYSIKDLQDLLREKNINNREVNNISTNNEQNEFNYQYDYNNSNQINYLNQQCMIKNNSILNSELKNKLLEFKEKLTNFFIKLENM